MDDNEKYAKYEQYLEKNNGEMEVVIKNGSFDAAKKFVCSTLLGSALFGSAIFLTARILGGSRD